MANAIDKEMAAYFMQLNEAEKKSVVQMLKTFLKSRKADPISLKQYNQELGAQRILTKKASIKMEAGTY